MPMSEPTLDLGEPEMAVRPVRIEKAKRPKTEVVTSGPMVVAEVTAPLSESASLMQIIGKLACDPNADVGKMERLMAMHEKLTARRAEEAFNAAMAAAQAEMVPVVRNKRNDQTQSNYADLAALADAIQPIITKHGFGPSFGEETCPREGWVRTVCDLSHTGGFSRRYWLDLPTDNAGIAGKVNKTGTHAKGSTLSYGRRYLKLMMFDIATKDDDGNAAGKTQDEINAQAPISEAQQEEIKRLIAEANSDIVYFCQYFKLDKLEDLKVKDFPRAKAALEGKKKTDAQKSSHG